jgi:tripeptidyl-peptidase-2
MHVEVGEEAWKLCLTNLFFLGQIAERVEKMFHLKVRGGSTLEICLQLLWLSNPAPADVVVDVEFHSLSVRAPSLASSYSLNLPPAQGFARFGVAADLRSETIKPKASLTTIRRTISPSTYEIVVDSKDQDTIPPSDAEMQNLADAGRRIYTMILTYKFKIESGEETKITPSFPSIFQQLYDSPLDSNIWVLQDSNTQTISFGGSMHHAKAVALAKGDYTLSLFVRHPSRQLLEQVNDMPLQLSFALGEKQSTDCKIYRQLDKASTPSVTGDGRNPVKSLVLPKGSQLDLYVTRPTAALPSWSLPGDVMIGSVTLNSDVKEATSIALSYTIPPKSQVKENGIMESNGSTVKGKSLNETLFDAKVAFLSTIRKNSTEFVELAAQLKRDNATHLPLLQEMLSFAKDRVDQYNTTSSRIVAIKDAVYAFLMDNGGPINETELAIYFGVSHVSLDGASGDVDVTFEKEHMEKQKAALQGCLLILCEALSEAAISESSFTEEFSSVYKWLRKWVIDSSNLSDRKDKLSLHLVESRYLRLCRNSTGAALSSLLKAQKELPEFTREISQDLLSVYQSLGGHTEHLISHLKDTLLHRFPPKA